MGKNSSNSLTHLQNYDTFLIFTENAHSMSKTTKKKTAHFEQDLSDLEGIVKKMEAGDLSLDDALKEFEKGVLLARSCQKTLNEAEQRIEILKEEGEKIISAAYEIDTPEDEE